MGALDSSAPVTGPATVKPVLAGVAVNEGEGGATAAVCRLMPTIREIETAGALLIQASEP